MTEEITDANPDTGAEASEVVESAESSTDTEQLQSVKDSDGFYSTTEFEPVEQKPEEKVDSETISSEETEQKTKPEESKSNPYHEDPAWQRIIKERDEARAALEEKTAQETFKSENFKHEISKEEKERNAVLDDFMNLDDDDLSDMMVNEPAKYRALSMQQLDREQTARARAEQTKTQEQTQQKQVETGLMEFFKEKEDGITLLKDGSIQKFINKNPAHNGISAYYELTNQANIDTAVKEAVEKATQETEEKIYKKLKAAGNAGSFMTSSGGRTIHDDMSAQKKNADKFGGRKAVALKLAKIRATG